MLFILVVVGSLHKLQTPQTLNPLKAFGWLKPGEERKQGLGIVRLSGNVIAFVCCGGSLLKKNKSTGRSILELVSAALAEGMSELSAILSETPVCCRAVAARDSVPAGKYESLVLAQADWNTLEVGPFIMQAAGQMYGGTQSVTDAARVSGPAVGHDRHRALLRLELPSQRTAADCRQDPEAHKQKSVPKGYMASRTEIPRPQLAPFFSGRAAAI